MEETYGTKSINTKSKFLLSIITSETSIENLNKSIKLEMKKITKLENNSKLLNKKKKDYTMNLKFLINIKMKSLLK